MQGINGETVVRQAPVPEQLEVFPQNTGIHGSVPLNRLFIQLQRFRKPGEILFGAAASLQIDDFIGKLHSLRIPAGTLVEHTEGSAGINVFRLPVKHLMICFFGKVHGAHGFIELSKGNADIPVPGPFVEIGQQLFLGFGQFSGLYQLFGKVNTEINFTRVYRQYPGKTEFSLFILAELGMHPALEAKHGDIFRNKSLKFTENCAVFGVILGFKIETRQVEQYVDISGVIFPKRKQFRKSIVGVALFLE